MKTMRRLLHVLSRVLVWLLLRPILFYQRFITPYTPTIVPLHADVLGVCPSGSDQARTCERTTAGYLAHPALQPLGRIGLRPCALTMVPVTRLSPLR